MPRTPSPQAGVQPQTIFLPLFSPFLLLFLVLFTSSLCNSTKNIFILLFIYAEWTGHSFVIGISIAIQVIHVLPFTSKGFFFSFIFISWRLITLLHCSGFCHTLTWISHGFTCIPHSDPPSHVPLHLIPLGLPSAPGPSTCLMHPAWAGDLFHPW